MMTIYQTASGQLYTFEALFRTVVIDRKAAWDADTQGSWERNQFPWFNDWLTEAVNTGVVTTLEVTESVDL